MDIRIKGHTITLTFSCIITVIESTCWKMRLHSYAHGYGFGSVLGRLFSRIGRKVIPKIATRAGLTIAKNVAKSAMRKVAPVAKRVIRKKLLPMGKKLAEHGLEMGLQYGLEKAENAAIKGGVDPTLVHKASNFVESGSRRGLKVLGAIADRKANQLLHNIPSTSTSVPTVKRHSIGRHHRGRRRGVGHRIKKHSLQSLIDLA